MEPFNKDEKYFRAKERVDKMKKFYRSLFSYVIFIGLLAGLNYYTNSFRHPWFLWAAFGWGLGLLFQAAKTFDWNPFFNSNWEQKKIKEFMEDDTNDTEPTIRY